MATDYKQIEVLGLTLQLTQEQLDQAGSLEGCFVHCIGPNGNDLVSIRHHLVGYTVNSFRHGASVYRNLPGLD